MSFWNGAWSGQLAVCLRDASGPTIGFPDDLYAIAECAHAAQARRRMFEDKMAFTNAVLRMEVFRRARRACGSKSKGPTVDSHR